MCIVQSKVQSDDENLTLRNSPWASSCAVVAYLTHSPWPLPLLTRSLYTLYYYTSALTHAHSSFFLSCSLAAYGQRFATHTPQRGASRHSLIPRFLHLVHCFASLSPFPSATWSNCLNWFSWPQPIACAPASLQCSPLQRSHRKPSSCCVDCCCSLAGRQTASMNSRPSLLVTRALCACSNSPSMAMSDARV